MSHHDKIARNTTYLTIASMLQKGIALVYFAIVSKAFEGSFGKYQFALAFTSVVIIFMDFGLGQILIREGAKHEEFFQQIITRIVRMKLALMALSGIVGMVIIVAADIALPRITSADVWLVALGSLVILVDTMTFLLFCIFRVLRQLQWEAISILLYQAAIFTVGYACVQAGAPIYFFVGALLCGSIVQCGFLYFMLRKVTPYYLLRNGESVGLLPDSLQSIISTRNLLLISAPFAIAGIIARMNSSFDIFLLKTLVDDGAVAIYSIATKLVIALTVIPGAFAAVYYPVISAALEKKDKHLHKQFMDALSYMLIVSLPIMIGVIFIGDSFIKFVWEKDFFRPAIIPLQILILGLPFLFVNYPLGYALNAANKQHINTMNMGIALVVNMIANAILIPRYSFTGAAIASLISTVLLVLLGLPWVSRIIQIDWRWLGLQAVKIVFAGLCMAFILFWIQKTYPLPVVIVIGALIYTVGILLLRVVTVAQLSDIARKALKRAS